jgi:hypothetical protein
MKESTPRAPWKRGWKDTREACKDRGETEERLDELMIWALPCAVDDDIQAADASPAAYPTELDLKYNQWLIERAREHDWDSEQRRRAESWGKRLSREPEILARRLAWTRQGSLWLSRRWEELGAALVERGGWTKLQRRLACNLLGIPKLFRETTREVPACNDTAALAELVRRELERHRMNRETRLNRTDALDRKVWQGIRDIEAMNHLPAWYYHRRLRARYREIHRRKNRQQGV